MKKIRIVAIGASTGGIEALQTLVAGLPEDFGAAVLVVQHVAPDGPGHLAHILGRAGRLRAQTARDSQPIHAGQIYVAPPDCHMLVDRAGVIRLSRAAKENRVRPAIDVLFRSAAVSFGKLVIGVVLTGRLDDGAAGLAAIKGCGGLAVVQDPDTAVMRSMPETALRHVDVDHCVDIARMAALLDRLVNEDPPQIAREISPMKKQLEAELKLLEGGKGVKLSDLGEPSLLTCPECHGALIEIRDSKPLRYRCHTGHAFTAASLASALQESTEASFWATIRSFQEAAMLLDVLSNNAKDDRDSLLAAELEHHAGEARRLADRLKEIKFENDESLDADAVKSVAEAEG